MLKTKAPGRAIAVPSAFVREPQRTRRSDNSPATRPLHAVGRTGGPALSRHLHCSANREGGRILPLREALTTYPTAVTWPRISPFGFLAVWTFTYVFPDSIRLISLEVSVAVPLTGEVQGPQMATNTPALTCRAAGP